MRLDVKVGDVVQLHTRRRDYSRVREFPTQSYPLVDVVVDKVITKVGRTLVYVDHEGGPAGFYKEDGRQRGEHTTWRMYTPETLKAHVHRRDLRARISEALKPYAWMDKYTTEALEDIVRILENPEAKEAQP